MTFKKATSILLLAAYLSSATALPYTEWESKFPACAQSCLDNYYQENFAPSCGAKGTADMNCICQHFNIKDTITFTSEICNCAVGKCTDQADVSAVKDAAGQVTHLCPSGFSVHFGNQANGPLSLNGLRIPLMAMMFTQALVI